MDQKSSFSCPDFQNNFFHDREASQNISIIEIQHVDNWIMSCLLSYSVLLSVLTISFDMDMKLLLMYFDYLLLFEKGIYKIYKYLGHFGQQVHK